MTAMSDRAGTKMAWATFPFDSLEASIDEREKVLADAMEILQRASERR